MKMTTWGGLHPHYSGANIHLERPDHRFRPFIKSAGEDTINRVEESLYPEKRAIEASPCQDQMLSVYTTGVLEWLSE
jgi:hypothetical protein